jgi:hypothetical protein
MKTTLASEQWPWTTMTTKTTRLSMLGWTITFSNGMISPVNRIIWQGRLDGNSDSSDSVTTLDYQIGKDDLLEECASRGMTTLFPKMKRIFIKELRFYDAND